MYGLPGAPGETRSTSEMIISKVFSKAGTGRTPILAHRLTQRQDWRMLIQFNCKQDAQETSRLFRELTNTSLEFFSLGENGKVEVRHHLSSGLAELLRSANIVRREVGWTYCRPLTSTQCVEAAKTKEPNSRKVTVRSISELVEFNKSLQTEGLIPQNSPANDITSAGPLRKRDREPRNKPYEAHAKRQTTGKSQE